MNKKRELILSSAAIVLPGLATLLWADPKRPEDWIGLGLPLFLLALHWLCIFFTLRDLRNRAQHPKVFRLVLWICPLTSLFVCATFWAAARGWVGILERGLPLFIGILFIAIGNYLPKCRPNHTIGIRVSWTLRSEENWNATHRITGKLWVAGGLAFLLGVFLPLETFLWAMLATLPVLTTVPLIYSYRYYKKQLARGDSIPASTPRSRIGIVVGVGMTVAALAFSLGLCFTGDIAVIYEADSFTIEASYWGDRTVAYADVKEAVYRTDFQPGLRVYGFGTPRLSMGSFRNEELGTYTLYAYTGCPSHLLLTMADETLVVGLVDDAANQELYQEIMERQP